MNHSLTSRGYALAATALKLVTATRTASGKSMAPKPVRAIGVRRKPAAK